MNPISLCLCALLCMSTVTAADEISALLKAHAVPERFANYTPRFQLERRVERFVTEAEPAEWEFMCITDHGKYVGYFVIRGAHAGYLFLVTHDPAQAQAQLSFPSERLHVDNSPGAGFKTNTYLPGGGWNKGDVSNIQVSPDGTAVVIKRQYKGTLPRRRQQTPLQVDHQATFRLAVDPHCGYCIDANWQTGLSEPADRTMYTNLFVERMSNPWHQSDIHERTVTSPIGQTGYLGHANNHAAYDRSDNNNSLWSLRDGGFVAHLELDAGWSWSTSLHGQQAQLTVCNVHADQDIHVKWRDGQDKQAGTAHGLHHHQAVRIQQRALPPELTRLIDAQAPQLFTEQKMVVLKLGGTVDFEDMPLSLGQPCIGLAWGGSGPTLSVAEARSGSKSLQIKGTEWPNLPQVVLEPKQRYRLEAWMKVTPASAADLLEHEKRHHRIEAQKIKKWRKQVAKAKAKGQTLPPEPEARKWTTPGPATAYISADYYTWSPHVASNKVLKQRTNLATIGDWQQVVLEFEAPAWGPFVDIRFICTGGGTAYLDDFSLRKIP